MLLDDRLTEDDPQDRVKCSEPTFPPSFEVFSFFAAFSPASRYICVTAHAREGLPHPLNVLKPLKVVFLFHPAFDPELRQDRHHLAERYSRQFRRPTE